MVRVDLVGQKMTRASAWLEDATKTLRRPLKEFVADTRERDLAAFYLLLAIQECIDIAAHWSSDEGWLPADDAASSFEILADHDVIERPLADEMRAAAGLRNRIAQGYALVDHARLHREAERGVPAVRAFLTAVAQAAQLLDREA